MTRWLVLLLILGATPSFGQEPRIIQLALTEEQWRELLELGGPVPVAPPVETRSLVLPTALYLSAVAAEWTTAAPACALQCNSWTRTLPGVNDAKVAVPLGLGITAGVLALVHYWIEPRWPRVSDALLFSLGTFHAASAVQHASSARTTLKGGAP